MKVAIIDYEMGNLFSVRHACATVGLEPVVTTNHGMLMESDAAILPGVGAFGAAMDNLRKLALIEPILEFISRGKPFMGICLGMQLLFDESEEFGTHQGLGLIKGRVVRFSNEGHGRNRIKVPQIGWNRIRPPQGREQGWKSSPLENIKHDEYMYFVHSYYALPFNHRNVLTVTEYEGTEYCSAVLSKNIFASQFHPEKSAQEGLKIYKSWAESVKKGNEKHHD